jgi:hypothetical protein
MIKAVFLRQFIYLLTFVLPITISIVLLFIFLSLPLTNNIKSLNNLNYICAVETDKINFGNEYLIKINYPYKIEKNADASSNIIFYMLPEFFTNIPNFISNKDLSYSTIEDEILYLRNVLDGSYVSKSVSKIEGLNNIEYNKFYSDFIILSHDPSFLKNSVLSYIIFIDKESKDCSFGNISLLNFIDYNLLKTSFKTELYNLGLSFSFIFLFLFAVYLVVNNLLLKKYFIIYRELNFRKFNSYKYITASYVIGFLVLTFLLWRHLYDFA